MNKLFMSTYNATPAEPTFPTITGTPTQTAYSITNTRYVYGYEKVGNYFYIANGQQQGDTTTYRTTLYRFDLVNKTWSTMADTGVNVRGCAMAASSTDLFVMGGYTGSGAPVSYFKSYNIASNKWTTRSIFAARGLGACGYYNGYVYFINGISSSSVTSNTIYKYEVATSTWTNTNATLPTKTSSPSFCTVGTRVYLFGGRWQEDYTHLNVFQYYDMATNTSASISLTNTPSVRRAGVLYEIGDPDYLYHYGGSTNSVDFKQLWKLPKAGGLCTLISSNANLPAYTLNGGGCFYDNKLWYFGGYKYAATAGITNLVYTIE